MTVTLVYAARPPSVLQIGGRDGGMKRALACSFDVTTGTMFRETVLRIPSPAESWMLSLPVVFLLSCLWNFPFAIYSRFSDPIEL